MSLLTNLRHRVKCLWTKTKNVTNCKQTTSRHYSSDYFKSIRCRVIVIIGGKNSPTLDLAESFADAGAKAVILGIPPNEELLESTDKLNEKYGEDKIIVEACDITKKSHVTQLFKLATKLFNGVDLVVNSADLEGQVDQTINLNIKSVLLGTLSGFYYMGTNTGGSGGTIINICSILGLEPFFGSPVYVGAKHFVLGFSRSLGSHYFHKLTNVKLFTVCVGINNTNMAPKGNTALPGFDCLSYDRLEHLGKKTKYSGKEFKNCLFSVLDDDENGSVWVVDDKEYYKANIPFRNAVKVCAPT